MGLIADFSITLEEGYSPMSVTFTANVIGTPTYYVWHFGDGDSAEGSDTVEHTYLKTGIFSPVLEIRNDTEFDTITKYNFIIVNYPSATSENTIIESYEEDSSRDWRFYVDPTLYLIFNKGGEVFKSSTPVISLGVWTLVEFHPGVNQFYVSTVNSGRVKVPTYSSLIGLTGMHEESRINVATNSSMKIDELKAYSKEVNLLDYFRSLQSSVYYLH